MPTWELWSNRTPASSVTSPAYILTKVYIPGYVVERLVDQFLSGVGGRVAVPGPTSEMLVVDTYGGYIPGKEPEVLVQGDSGHVVARVKPIVEWRLSGRISVVDAMMPPVVEGRYGTRCFLVVILNVERGHAPGDV